MADSVNKGLRWNKEPPSTSGLQGTNHLLVIGINEYQHCAKLRNAVSDAEQVMGLLQGKFQFEPQHSLTCFDRQATWDGIDRSFDQVAEKMEKQDNLLIYFSGHGHFEPKTGSAYWVPADARFQQVRDYYSYDRLIRRLKSIEAQHIFLVVDSCYSGAVLVTGTRSGLERLERDPSRWILASGRNEVVPDGEVGGSSPFATQFLDVLDRYAGDGLPVIELVSKVTTAVVHNARQTPIGCPLQDVGDKGGQFIFHPKRKTRDQKDKKEVVPQTPKHDPYQKEETPIGESFQGSGSRVQPSSLWNQLWTQPVARLGIIFITTLILGVVGYSLWPKGQSYSQLMEEAQTALDEQGDRKAALVLFERAQKKKDTPEVRDFISTIKLELNSFSEDSLRKEAVLDSLKRADALSKATPEKLPKENLASGSEAIKKPADNRVSNIPRQDPEKSKEKGPSVSEKISIPDKKEPEKTQPDNTDTFILFGTNLIVYHSDASGDKVDEIKNAISGKLILETKNYKNIPADKLYLLEHPSFMVEKAEAIQKLLKKPCPNIKLKLNEMNKQSMSLWLP